MPNPTLLFQSAFSAHQQGQLEAAKVGYEQVLLVNKNHVDALHLLGLVCGQRGDLAEGEKWIRKAIAQKENSIFWSNLGHILRNTQRPEKAEQAYMRAIQVAPDNIDAHKKLSHLLHEGKRFIEAEAAYLGYLKLRPHDAQIHNDLGSLLKDSSRPRDAERAFRHAIELQPGYAQAHYNLGNLLYENGRLGEAERAYRDALDINPNYVEASKNLGHLLHACKRLAEAQTAYRHVLKIKPGDAEAFNNLGNVLSDCRYLDEAEAAYQQALSLKPDYASAHNNLAALFTESKQRLTVAEAGYRRALNILPSYGDARFNLSLLLLLLQRYEEAWPLYESRYASDRKNPITVPRLPFPQWQGQSLAGKSLVIWPEQGFGDYIQFVRYAFQLKARGLAHLTLACSRPLQELFGTVKGVDAVVTDMAQLEPHDYWCFVMSLPLHFATCAKTIPVAPLPYVHALPERIAQWRDRLPAAGFRVGLVWRGNPSQRNDIHRSLPGLATLAPLWSVPGVTFISLQKGFGEEEAAHPPSGQPLVNLGGQIADFADTAAIMSQLDLVISVCTASAHLAGALGKPCWVLLPAMGADWRWQLERTDSPWYPYMRLFRQTDLQRWDKTIFDVAAALSIQAE